MVDYKRDTEFRLVFQQYSAKKDAHRGKTREQPAKICHLDVPASTLVTVGVITSDYVLGCVARNIC